MITITLQGYLTLKQQVGTRQLPVPTGSSLRDLLALLERDLGLHFEDEPIEAGALRGQLIVLVNGVHCRHLPESLSTILKDGDRVAIFPPVAGGSGVAYEGVYPLPPPPNSEI
ncbi:MAG: MoaD/ThiS family protein [Anaerolineales bacterium]